MYLMACVMVLKRRSCQFQQFNGMDKLLKAYKYIPVGLEELLTLSVYSLDVMILVPGRHDRWITLNTMTVLTAAKIMVIILKIFFTIAQC